MGKDSKRKISYKTEEQKEITRLIIIIVVVALLVVGVYFFTRAVITKDLFTHKTTEEEVVPGEVDPNAMIVGNMLTKPEKEYYVAVYASSNTDYSMEMANIITEYSNKKKHSNVYFIDLDNHFNKSFYDPENINLDAKEVSDLRFGDVTLLKISKGKIAKSFQDLSKIKKELGVK